MDFKKNRVAKKKFAQGGSDLNKMLEKQMNGELDSWAIRWFYNQFKFDGLTLYPVRSKVSNEGFGEEATHTSGSDRRYVPMIDSQHSTEFTFPKDITITPTAQQKFQLKMGYLARIRSKLETLLLK